MQLYFVSIYKHLEKLFKRQLRFFDIQRLIFIVGPDERIPEIKRLIRKQVVCHVKALGSQMPEMNEAKCSTKAFSDSPLYLNFRSCVKS